MSVSINAYTRIKKKHSGIVAGTGDLVIDAFTGKELWRAYVNPGFPLRAGQVEDRACYEYSAFVEGIELSCSGYNLWREELAKLAGWPWGREEDKCATGSHAASAWRARGGPFWELIYFTDSYGVLGGRASAKLAKDFVQFQSTADAHPDPEFRDRYARMR